MKAQELIAEVYNAIRTRPALWNSTLLVILYDEHGGFYDHVVPPKAVAPDQHNEEYTFDRLGIRVPALLVSPWVKRGVLSERFDHTSLLRYLSDKWDLGPLGARTAEAKSFAGSIGYLNAPRGDTPLSIEVTPVAEVMKADLPSELKPDHPLNGHQLALIAFTEQLEKEIAEPAAKPIREMAMTAGPVAQVRSAKLRVEEFLAQQRMAAKGN